MYGLQIDVTKNMISVTSITYKENIRVYKLACQWMWLMSHKKKT